MLPSTLFSSLIGIITLFVMNSNAEIPIRLITHNIRFATTTPGTGEKPWSDRRPLLVNQLKYNTLYNPESFICLQEVLHQQLLDIVSDLNTNNASQQNQEAEWAYIGVGRNDGQTKGEYSPILYRRAVWEVEDWKTVWLSETPDRPSKGWDAASIRIVTVAVFKHVRTGRRVVGLNTHLDDQGEVSRTESAKLILKTIEGTVQANASTSLPIWLAGDFNSERSGTAYRVLNGEGSVVGDVRDGLGGWRYGNVMTFTGFQRTTGKAEIDFLFVGPRGRGGVWRVVGSSVLGNVWDEGVFNSDHRAVVGDLVLL